MRFSVGWLMIGKDVKPQSRHSSALRRLVGVCLCLAFCLTGVGFGPPVLTDGAYPPLRLGPDDIVSFDHATAPAGGDGKCGVAG